jgi:hypothetical protein
MLRALVAFQVLRQHVERRGDLGLDLVDRQQAHPRRGQLDRQRQPAQPAHQPRDARRLRRQIERRLRRARAQVEQTDRVVVAELLRVARRHGQPVQRQQPFAGRPEPPARCGQHLHPGRGGQHAIDPGREPLDRLGVVQDQQRAPARQVRSQRRTDIDRAAGLCSGVDPEHLDHTG